MAASNSQVVAGQMERVRPKLQELYETTTLVAGLIKKASESHRISFWNQALASGQTLQAFRVPVQQYDGGDYGTFNLDEGDMGSGSMTQLQYMTLAAFPDRLAVEISSLAQDSTATSEQAVINTFKWQMKRAMKTMQHYYDTALHGDGTGVIAVGNGTGAPAGVNPTYNLEANFGPQRLRYNQPVDIYSSDGTVQRGTGLRVSSYNLQNKTVSLTGTVTGPTNTDQIAFSGMSAPLAVGSYRAGLYTYQNTAISGSTAGLSRTTVPELVTPSVAGGGNGLSPSMPLLLWDQMTQRRDEDALQGVVGISHQSQRAAWYLQGMGISEWHRGGSDKMIDLVPQDIALSTRFKMAGVDHYVSKKHDRSRIDWIIPKNWCRAMLHDLKFHELPDGTRFFPLRSVTTGNIKAGFSFYLRAAENIINVDPGAGGVIPGLALPSGY